MKQTANKTPKQIFSPLSSRRARGVAFCLALAALLLTSCFSDDTTLAERQLSEIVIDGTSMKEVYDINKNETLTVTPRYTQTNGDKSVTTTWEIDQQTYSNEPTLTYTGKELGSWNCRLILENEDGKTFFPFKLNVNSPYEEGITILSRDSDQTPPIWCRAQAASSSLARAGEQKATTCPPSTISTRRQWWWRTCCR